MVFEWFQQQDDDSSIVMKHIALIEKNEIISKMGEAIKVRILLFVFLFCSIMAVSVYGFLCLQSHPETAEDIALNIFSNFTEDERSDFVRKLSEMSGK